MKNICSSNVLAPVGLRSFGSLTCLSLGKLQLRNSPKAYGFAQPQHEELPNHMESF